MSSQSSPRIVEVMPAYNAASTLQKTYDAIPHDIVSHIILVDDFSQDDTSKVAKKLGLEVVRHPRNRGYGGNQKTCYNLALKRGADIVVMLHPDYQYDPTRIPAIVQPIINGEADLVLGSRLLNNGALKGGMPKYKYVSNRFLTSVENMAFGTQLSEFHTGFRAYSRKLLETIPYEHNSEDFVFDTEVIAQTVYFNFPISEISVETRYFPEASSINWYRSSVYGLSTLGVVGRFLLHRHGLRQSKHFVSS